MEEDGEVRPEGVAAAGGRIPVPVSSSVPLRTPARCSLAFDQVDPLLSAAVDIEYKVIAFVIGIVLLTIAVVRSRPRSKRGPVEFPPMGRINVSCDPELLEEYVKALTEEHLNFLHPAKPEGPMPYGYSSFQSKRCFILVAEKDYPRAEQIIAEVDRRFFQ